MKHRILRPIYTCPKYKLRYLQVQNKNHNTIPVKKSTSFSNPYYRFKNRLVGKLHYLGCHAPIPIQKKWKPVWDKLCFKHKGDLTKQSYRYMLSLPANKYL